ncbi:MAG: pantoate--beta-alanine ligase [Candidatus Desantisbacteria bacterium]
MEIISKIKTMQETADSLRHENKRIGFVPTMGALHQGHFSLINAAKKENDALVVSIFVNPIQFSPEEDYGSYPIALEKDTEICKQMGVDIIFCPEATEMYSERLLTTVNVSEITSGLCGSFRPCLFQGVTTVVTKLFHAVKPHVAYFGQKDYQQAAVIKRMVMDLNFDVEIRVLPIVREEGTGLALSSRNAYLNPEERAQAGILFETLRKAKLMLDDGERDGVKLSSWMKENIEGSFLALLEYAEVCDTETLKPLLQIETRALLALAVKIGKTRLIDNMIWEQAG